MKLRNVLLTVLTAASTMFTTGCSNSSKLCIVHFDQAILGDAQKDLGVSIGLTKENSELENAINEILDNLPVDTRNKMMSDALSRASDKYDNLNYQAYEVPTNATKTLRVGLECDYAPFNWTDVSANAYNYKIKGSNEYADGYDIAISRFLANQLGYNLEIVKLGWEALIPALQENQIDVVIAGMTDTEERRQSISFTHEYYVSELVLVVKENSKYAKAKSLEDFANARIVSQESTVTNDVIEAWVSKYNVNHLSPLDTFSTCAIAVTNGTADAMTAELPVAEAIVNGSM